MKKPSKKTRRIVSFSIFAAVMLAVIITAIVIYVRISAKNAAYDEANKLINSGKYIEAAGKLESLGDFKDCMQLRESISVNVEVEYIKKAGLGDIVTYGNYGDNNEWIVLKSDIEKVLLISRYPIASKPFDESGDNIWEKSSIRKWLNIEYFDEAFSMDEQENILAMNIVNEDKYGASMCVDQIFLLSDNELDEYFSSAANRLTGKEGDWWGRSITEKGVSFVDVIGNIVTEGDDAGAVKGIRPAMWIDVPVIPGNNAAG